MDCPGSGGSLEPAFAGLVEAGKPVTGRIVEHHFLAHDIPGGNRRCLIGTAARGRPVAAGPLGQCQEHIAGAATGGNRPATHHRITCDIRSVGSRILNFFRRRAFGLWRVRKLVLTGRRQLSALHAGNGCRFKRRRLAAELPVRPKTLATCYGDQCA